jgi:hypothetical protein
MQNPKQWAYQLARQSLAPAAIHLLRTTPPEVTRPEAKRLDWLFFRFMLEVCYWEDGNRFWGDSEPRRLTPEAWQAIMADPGPQALRAKALMHVRISQGGLGIPCLESTAIPAYAGSILLCAADIARRGFAGADFEPSSMGATALPSFAAIEGTVGVTCVSAFEKARRGQQAALSVLVRASEYLAALKMVEADPQAKANFLSRATPEAGAFLLAPAAVRRYQIADPEFSVLLRNRMGLPQVPGVGGPDQPAHLLCMLSTERTRHEITAAGDHAMVCIRGTKAADARHNIIVDIVHAKLNKVFSKGGSNFTTEKEPLLETRALWTRKDDGNRVGPVGTEFEARDRGRGDIMIIKASDPLTARILDVAIVHPSLATHKDANRVAGSAAAHRWTDKGRQYESRWGKTIKSGQVVPIIIETGGRWHPESFKFLKMLFGSEAGAEGKALFRDMLMETSTQLQRHCARAIRALSIRSYGVDASVGYDPQVTGLKKAGDLRTYLGPPALAGAQ